MVAFMSAPSDVTDKENTNSPVIGVNNH